VTLYFGALTLGALASHPSFTVGPTLPDCGAQSIAPGEFTLACGDGNYRLTRMTWPTWGGATANGHGLASANDCTPDCASGHFHTFPVSAVASKIAVCASGRKQYTRLVLTYGTKRPAGIKTTDVWTFPCDAPGPSGSITATPATVSTGASVKLVGTAWATSADCSGKVVLSTIHGTFATVTPSSPAGHFAATWKATGTGKVTVIARETCSSASIGSRLWESTATVSVHA
jgi:hypothetical protein